MHNTPIPSHTTDHITHRLSAYEQQLGAQNEAMHKTQLQSSAPELSAILFTQLDPPSDPLGQGSTRQKRDWCIKLMRMKLFILKFKSCTLKAWLCVCVLSRLTLLVSPESRLLSSFCSREWTRLCSSAESCCSCPPPRCPRPPPWSRPPIPPPTSLSAWDQKVLVVK